MKHFGYLLVLAPPFSPFGFLDVIEIEAAPQPNPHLIGRADGDRDVPLEFRP